MSPTLVSKWAQNSQPNLPGVFLGGREKGRIHLFRGLAQPAPRGDGLGGSDGLLAQTPMYLVPFWLRSWARRRSRITVGGTLFVCFTSAHQNAPKTAHLDHSIQIQLSQNPSLPSP